MGPFCRAAEATLTLNGSGHSVQRGYAVIDRAQDLPFEAPAATDTRADLL
jgi:hypothetical protein